MSQDQRFAGLSNEEIVLIHETTNTYLIELEDKLKENKIHQKVNTPVGEMIRVHKLTDDQVKEVRGSEHYRTHKSIVDKLAPIVEIIKDSNVIDKIKS